jgi:hypothetical protein
MKNHIPTLRKLYLKIDCTNKYPKDSWIMWVLLLFVSVVCTYMSYKYDCTFRAPFSHLLVAHTLWTLLFCICPYSFLH